MNSIDPWGLVALSGSISAKPWDNILGPPDPCGPAFGAGLAFGISAFWDWLWSENNNDDYPANPDDWVPPDGWVETDAGKKTGGKHRQWKKPNGDIGRRWDKEGREGGKKRGPHWHDPRYPNKHIPPNR